jgi:hypothetical protein
MKRTFWMVLGSGTPVVRHRTLDAARSEAERLAMQQPGQEFAVLEAVAVVKKSELQWQECHPDAGDESIPF